MLRFLDYTQRHKTVGRTALDDGSARRRDLYLTTHNTYMRQISMFLAGFEPAIPVTERPQTLALDCWGTGIGQRKDCPGVKRSGRGVNHPPPSSAEVKERVELYLYSPSGHSWSVLGRNDYNHMRKCTE